MECVSLLGKCRACQIKTQKEFQHHIFTTENLQQMFHEATSLEIHDNDGLPEILCDDCHSRLIDAFKFRQMCASSVQIFQQILAGEIDSDYEEKYQPPEFPNEEEMLVPEQEMTVTDEKFNPLDLEPQSSKEIAQENEASKTRIIRKRKVKKIPISEEDSLLDPQDDPDWGKNKVKTRNQNKFSTKVRKTQKRKEIKPPSDSSSDEATEVTESPEVVGKDEPEDAVKIKTQKTSKRACKFCGKEYVGLTSLRRHIEAIHEGLKDECKVCHRQFTRPETLRAHMVRIHNVQDMFKCKECGKVFGTEEGLANHIKEWHDPDNPKEKLKNHVCEFCGKSFISNAHLKTHMLYHSGFKPFSCSLCPKAFYKKHLLKDHMLVHEDIKNHICTVCGLRKTTMRELKVHMNIHTKEKTFTCEYCSKVFLAAGGLSRHVKVVHQGIKKFECPHCENSFGKKETLKYHIMTHTGERPHACEVCGKRFIQPTALQTHMKTHRKFN